METGIKKRKKKKVNKPEMAYLTEKAAFFTVSSGALT